MRKQRGSRIALLGTMFGLVLTLPLGTAAADSASSTNYKVSDTQFGSGGAVHLCSTDYCSSQSVGSTVVCTASSSHYKAEFGPDIDQTPLLEVITQNGASDLGVIDSSHTATTTMIVKVRTYLSSGYTLELTGSPPNQGTHSLNPLTSPSTSQPGTEQFGINLVANTTPAVGTNPVQVPSSQFSFGNVKADYSTPNLFKYIDGGNVANSSSSSGETDYTISMILNVSNVTPGGYYVANYSAVAVPVF